MTFEQIKAISFGAVKLEETSEGIRFWKCTDKQLAAWYALTPQLGNFSETTTGVMLDFHTDSEFVDAWVSGGKFELFVNGSLQEQHLFADNDYHEIQLSLEQRDNRITIVFPSHSVGKLRSIRVAENAYVKPHTYDERFLFLGDSITQGWNSQFDSNSYAHRVANYFNAERVINGIGGAIYSPATFDVSSFHPDVVFVAYGTNDYGWYPSLEAFRTEVAQYFAAVKNAYGDKLVYVITPPRRFDEISKPMGSFEDCKQCIAQEAEKYDFHVIDGYSLIPNDYSFFADVVHPNDAGFGKYAENLISEIERYRKEQ